jgi:hypothetical protein
MKLNRQVAIYISKEPSAKIPRLIGPTPKKQVAGSSKMV